MYYDPNEHEQRELGETAERGRVQRDIAGLAMMTLGVLCTLIAAYAWSPLSGITLTGVYLAVGGWFVASGQSN